MAAGNGEERERYRAIEVTEGVAKWGHEREMADPCPDDPQQVCQIFKAWSADRWNGYAVMAHLRFLECGCSEPPQLPPGFILDCGQPGLTCEDVCAAFEAWALEFRLWALRFTDTLVECFPDGWKPKKVPQVPHCGACDKSCKAMRKFHKGLSKWWTSIMVPLNSICDTGGTDPVPSPPEPPPFA